MNIDRLSRIMNINPVSNLIDEGAVPKSDDAFIDLLLSVQTPPREDKAEILKMLRPVE